MYTPFTCAECHKPIRQDEPYRQFVWAGFLSLGGTFPDMPDLRVHESHTDFRPPNDNYHDVTRDPGKDDD